MAATHSAFDLDGKVAVVTGGGRGIGLAIAAAYAEAGARVIVADRAGDEARAAAEGLGPAARGIGCDVTDSDSIKAMVAAVVEWEERVDILVNNAAVFDLAPILDVTEDSYRRVFGVNVEGLIFTTKAVARHMVDRGDGGKIINMASQAGRRGEALVPVYCASKAAVISITQSLALDLIRHRINVNAISPGVVDTPMWDAVDALFARYENRPAGEKKRLVGEAVPFGRMGMPEDLAGAAVFLASSASDYVVGQTLNVDGGNCLN